MVRMTHWDEGTELMVQTQDGVFPAMVHEEFWYKETGCCGVIFTQDE